MTTQEMTRRKTYTDTDAGERNSKTKAYRESVFTVGDGIRGKDAER